MNKLLYLLVLVGAVSLTAYISASGEFDAGENGCIPVGTSSSTPVAHATNTPVDYISTPTAKPTKEKCNQGLGNGPEGCDPGFSNHNQPSNDERGRKPGTPGPRGR